MNSVVVTWVANDDGAAPEGFYVQIIGPEGFARTAAVPAPSTYTEMAGLKNGVEYSFTVVAATRDGSAAPSAQVSATPTTGMEGVVAGLIVEFAPGSEKSQGETNVPGQERVPEIDLVVADKVTDDAVLVEFSELVDVATATRIADELAQDEQVQWAEPDQFFFTSNTATSEELAQTVSVPSDSDYATSQWNLWDAYGISIGDGNQTMTDAWAGPRGDGVNVAVIDTGITPHPDLDGQLVSGYDFVSNPEKLAAIRQPNAPPVAFDGDYIDEATYGVLGRDGNPIDPGDWRGVTPTRDSSWHGTKVAGVIVAANNSDGITGIAPNAKIQPIRALSWRGGLLSDIAASVTWASGGSIDGVPENANPSKVINMSFAVEAMCPTALQQAIDGARERGSILVAASGNAADDAAKFAPGNCNGVITVAASNRDGQRADYSNYGEKIDISAPGGDAANPIATTSNTGIQTLDQASVGSDFGTSAAAAHVSAAAAILVSRNASLTPDQAYEQLTGNEYTQAFANNICDFASPDYSCGSGILSLAQVATACTPTTVASGAYTVVTFQGAGTCTWTKPTGVTSVDVLAVGGGGGGGAWVGGGGGGGGVVQTFGVSVADKSTVSVTVGAGGVGAQIQAGSSALSRSAASGGDSTFASTTAVVAKGGGLGASSGVQSAESGGSGGGGSLTVDLAGGAGETGQGNKGGDGSSASGDSAWPHPTGGGGGAGTAGSNFVSATQSGNGGAGTASSISGASVVYGGGGGGGIHGGTPNTDRFAPNGLAGTGGAGGGGDGAGNGRGASCNPCVADSGEDGLGGGGGGSGGAQVNGDNRSIASTGGDGGDGVVVIRYAAPAVATCNVGFGELDFNYANKQNQIGTGFNLGDKVLFPGVATKICDGVSTEIDALVTTSALVDSTIVKYEAGARASREDSYFQVDTSVSANNGYAEFTFDFYKSGTYGSTNQRVILQNVNVTGIDIDARQFNYFSGFDSYTVATNTRLTTVPSPISTFPADGRFVGPSGSYSNSPRDQVVTTYGEVDTFKVRAGNTVRASQNFFGFAFKELGWGTTTPVTTGTQYTITYDANGADSGTAPPAQTGGVGEVFETRDNTGSMLEADSTFGGWNTAADGSGTSYVAGASISMPVNGITLYAVWIPTPRAFVVSYDANGGSGAPANQVQVSGSTAIVSSTLPTRLGYTLASWNTASDGTGTGYAAGSTFVMPAGNVTLYAIWIANAYVVSYNGNGGTGVPSATSAFTGGSFTISNTVPTYTNYTFAGWNTEADGTGTPYASGASFTMPASTVTLFAQWTPVAYTLTYDANGGSGAPPNASVNYAATATVSGTVPTRTGYWFNGWNTVADGSGTSYPSSATFTMVGNVTLYAQWVSNIYNLVYNANGGSGGAGPDTFGTGVTVTVSADTPTRTGYTFAGWNATADGSGTTYISPATFLMPASNTTLYAQWTVNPYAVTYLANEGSGTAPDPQTANYLEKIVIAQPTLLVRSGYTFTGWNTALNGTGNSFAAGGDLLMPAANVTLYAQWIAQTNAVIYNLNGGNAGPNVAEATSGSVVTISREVPTRNGFTFRGWNTAVDGSGTSYAPGRTFTMPASNVTLFAQWTSDSRDPEPNVARVCSISFNTNGGIGVAPTVSAPCFTWVSADSGAGLSRQGSDLTGWNTSPSGTGAGFDLGAPLYLSGDNTLFAQWRTTSKTPPSDENGEGGNPSGPPERSILDPAVIASPPGEPVLIDPFTNDPPAGQEWKKSSVRIVDPSTGKLRKRVVTKQGTWRVDTTTGEISFLPAARFTGTAEVRFRILTNSGAAYRSKVMVTIDPAMKPKLRKLSTTVYFPSMSSQLDAGARRVLRELVRKVSNRGTDVKTLVVGYVEPVGRSFNDFTLSDARARSAARYLRTRGITTIFTAEGLGRAQETGWKSRRATATIWYSTP